MQLNIYREVRFSHIVSVGLFYGVWAEPMGTSVMIIKLLIFFLKIVQLNNEN